jgi:hypothetical protein
LWCLPFSGSLELAKAHFEKAVGLPSAAAELFRQFA